MNLGIPLTYTNSVFSSVNEEKGTHAWRAGDEVPYTWTPGGAGNGDRSFCLLHPAVPSGPGRVPVTRRPAAQAAGRCVPPSSDPCGSSGSGSPGSLPGLMNVYNVLQCGFEPRGHKPFPRVEERGSNPLPTGYWPVALPDELSSPLRSPVKIRHTPYDFSLGAPDRHTEPEPLNPQRVSSKLLLINALD